MFGLSFTHLIILGIIALIFIGPEQLPEMARTFARLLNEWKRASSDLRSSFTNTIHDNPPPKSPPVAKVEEPPPPVMTEVPPEPLEDKKS